MSLVGVRFAILLVCSAFVGCTGSSTLPCGDGGRCPTNLVCVDHLGVCADKRAVTVCAGRADGTTCDEVFDPGVCISGLCQEAICGDLFVTHDEDCDDGNDQAGDNCLACRFETCGNGVLDLGEECDCSDGSDVPDRCLARNSDEAGAECRSDCVLHCGDGIINEAEECEASVSPRSCTEIGFDRGPIECDETCDETLRACGRIGFSRGVLPVVLEVHVATYLRENGRAMVSSQSWFSYLTGPYGSLSEVDTERMTSVSSAVEGFVAYAFWGRGDNEVYAVGASQDRFGKVMLHDGNGWSEFSGYPAGSSLMDVWGDADALWVGGLNGQVYRHDENGWHDLSFAGTDNVTTLVALDSGEIIAATSSLGAGTGLWRKSGASAWQRITAPDVRFLDLWTDGAEVVAVGLGGTICRLSGGGDCVAEASGVSLNLVSVSGTGPDSLVAAGAQGTILYFDGNSWLPVHSGTTNGFSAVHGNQAGQILAIQGGVDGNLGQGFSFSDGGAFYQPGPPEESLRVAAVSELEAYFTGGTLGEMLHWKNGNLQAIPTPLNAKAGKVYVRSGSEVYALLAQTTLARFDGNASWDDVTPNGVTAPLKQVAGDATRLVVGGDGGGLFVDAGAGWEDRSLASSSAIIRSIWVGDGELYVIALEPNTDGYLLREVDGELEVVLERPGLFDVWASSSTDVWTVTNVGVVEHFDGAVWTESAAFVGNFYRGISGTGPGDVFVHGFARLHHYNGTAWSLVRLDGGTANDVAATPRRVFMAGAGSRLLFRPTPW
jgi:hypothetical protein